MGAHAHAEWFKSAGENRRIEFDECANRLTSARVSSACERVSPRACLPTRPG
jgi:hypothetical protein